jgi:F-type H+-transporting ATPase subunit b
MHQKKIAFLILLFIPFLLFMSSEEGSSASNSMDFLGKVINFLILFGGLVFLLRKPLGNFLQKRADSLKGSMQEAEDSREEAELRLKEIGSRTKTFDDEIKKIREAAENEGARLYKNSIQKADREAGRLRELTRQEIQRLTQAGIREIKEHIADLATDLARQNISSRMTGEYQSSLIDQSIDRLEKLDEKPGTDKKIRAGSH